MPNAPNTQTHTHTSPAAIIIIIFGFNWIYRPYVTQVSEICWNRFRFSLVPLFFRLFLLLLVCVYVSLYVVYISRYFVFKLICCYYFRIFNRKHAMRLGFEEFSLFLSLCRVYYFVSLVLDLLLIASSSIRKIGRSNWKVSATAFYLLYTERFCNVLSFIRLFLCCGSRSFYLGEIHDLNWFVPSIFLSVDFRFYSWVYVLLAQCCCAYHQRNSRKEFKQVSLYGFFCECLYVFIGCIRIKCQFPLSIPQNNLAQWIESFDFFQQPINRRFERELQSKNSQFPIVRNHISRSIQFSCVYLFTWNYSL